MNVLIETLQSRITELERENARYENGRVILCNLIDSLTQRLLEKRSMEPATDQNQREALEGIAACCTCCPCCEMQVRIARQALSGHAVAIPQQILGEYIETQPSNERR